MGLDMEIKIRAKRYGWRRDTPDPRDFYYTAPMRRKLPSAVDLRYPYMPVVYNQGELGSCTAQAIAASIQYSHWHQCKPDFMPSRLFIYYNERVLEHSVSSDSGATLRDGMKTVNKQGACAESMWPYKIGKFAVRPTPTCYKSALADQVTIYQRLVQSLSQLKACLAAGYPFVFGFSVFSSFESSTVTRTGVVPMPRETDEYLGGHAVLAVGYSNASRRFIVRNSWGSDWGIKGYFTMPYEYVTSPDLSDDFWVINTVE